VSVNIVTPASCIATYTFTGHSTPPKSITFYGQNFTANTFAMSTLPGPNAALANINVAGGGTSASPALITGFSSANMSYLTDNNGKRRSFSRFRSTTISTNCFWILINGFLRHTSSFYTGRYYYG
jgi:hypothetical protein